MGPNRWTFKALNSITFLSDSGFRTFDIRRYKVKSWITRPYCTRGIGVFYHRNAHCDISYSVQASCSLNLLNSCDTKLSRSWSLSCGNCWTVGIAIKTSVCVQQRRRIYTALHSRVCTKSFTLFFAFNRFCFVFHCFFIQGIKISPVPILLVTSLSRPYQVSLDELANQVICRCGLSRLHWTQ